MRIAPKQKNHKKHRTVPSDIDQLDLNRSGSGQVPQLDAPFWEALLEFLEALTNLTRISQVPARFHD